MNIALIYPNISVRERYGADIGEIGGRQAPLGVLYLSSFLKKNGHNICVIDAAAENLSDNEVLRRLKNHKTEIVGISSTSVALRNSQKLADAIKAEIKSIITIIGGSHISSDPESFKEMPQFDFAISGEGEHAFAKFADAVKNGADFLAVSGLIWKKNDELQINSGEYIEDLDTLPFPDRDAIPKISLYRPPIGCYLREPVVSIITSRGCPYKCIFCDKSVFGNKIRFFSTEYVLSEIELIIKKYGARELAFLDDTFPCNKTRFYSILEGIIKKNFKIKWSCMANANDLDKDTVKLMQKAGCWQIAIGIESGDDKILTLIKKKSKTDEIAKIAEIAHREGIYVKGFFMLGHPGETEKTIEKTKNFALSLPLTDVTCTIATPIKGSEFYKIASSEKYGKFNTSAEQSKFNYWTPVFIPKHLTPEILLKKQKEFFKKFYLRPKVLWRQLLKIRSAKTLFRIFRTIIKILSISNANK